MPCPKRQGLADTEGLIALFVLASHRTANSSLVAGRRQPFVSALAKGSRWAWAKANWVRRALAFSTKPLRSEARVMGAF
jgi:hypothetical protein